MRSEADLRRSVDRGNKARQVLDSDLFTEAVEAVKSRIWDEWATSPMDGYERNALIQRLKLEALNEVLAWLKSAMTSGKLDLQTLSEMEDGKRHGPD